MKHNFRTLLDNVDVYRKYKSNRFQIRFQVYNYIKSSGGSNHILLCKESGALPFLQSCRNSFNNKSDNMTFHYILNASKNVNNKALKIKLGEVHSHMAGCL